MTKQMGCKINHWRCKCEAVYIIVKTKLQLKHVTLVPETLKINLIIYPKLKTFRLSCLSVKETLNNKMSGTFCE